jgi:hypothetical protein
VSPLPQRGSRRDTEDTRRTGHVCHPSHASFHDTRRSVPLAAPAPSRPPRHCASAGRSQRALTGTHGKGSRESAALTLYCPLCVRPCVSVYRGVVCVLLSFVVCGLLLSPSLTEARSDGILVRHANTHTSTQARTRKNNKEQGRDTRRGVFTAMQAWVACACASGWFRSHAVTAQWDAVPFQKNARCTRGVAFLLILLLSSFLCAACVCVLLVCSLCVT